jgi:hypothetical protein
MNFLLLLVEEKRKITSIILPYDNRADTALRQINVAELPLGFDIK